MRAPARYLSTALCLLVLAAITTWSLRQWGFTPLTAIILALAISCPVAVLYAWWLGRRALRAVERAGIESTPEKHNNSTRRSS
jgi:CHASE2 domain-containing sensor protein